MTDTFLSRASEVLDAVCDPEIPVLTIRDLGILRELRMADDGVLEVVITPTYSGCPAMNAIEVNIRAALQEAGMGPVRVVSVLRPAWTTDWMTEEGKRKLRDFGIAPPEEGSMDKKALLGERHVVRCPHCNSDNTEMIAQFGSTSCKAMFKCLDCLEPFDYFKCH